MKSYEELLDFLNGTFPDYEVLEDNNGQLVIYTGLRVNSKEELELFESE